MSTRRTSFSGMRARFAISSMVGSRPSSWSSSRERFRRRLMVSINYNIDIGDYVEWSGENLYNPLATNEAYKFMINYIVYGMTH